MKRAIIALLISCSVLISGCATDVERDAKAAQKEQQEKDPEVGMTKQQVLSRYGKPDNILTSNEGEVWVYNLNKGEAYIPFNYGYRPKLRTLTFDQDGKVARWSYSK
jgi:outer membrane protein assembly factor BamE (lipoprotein component of BamABCDE complex)